MKNQLREKDHIKVTTYRGSKKEEKFRQLESSNAEDNIINR